MWEVLALRYGTLRSTRAHQYLRWDATGEPDGARDLDYFFWLLRDGDRVVVIDTGFSETAAARRSRCMNLTPAAALAAVGVDPAAVDTLLLTHLHFDHVGNVAMFDRARVLAPGRELDFWSGPLGNRPQLGSHIEREEIELLLSLERSGRLERFDARPADAPSGRPPRDEELLPGVTAVALPGHSPGLHGLLVQTAGRPVLLCSDAVHFYEEIEHDWAYSILTDLPAMYASYDRVRELVAAHDATLVVGHDTLVCQRFERLAGSVDSVIGLRIV